ncbi:MAG: hypothetical protein KatS3mg076_2913 [Candidatus Binatia bacterium]|nr:MAG: hypothetical protein KatS3mg076_2913 [Candidatus Binatia bacterium]
MQAEGPGGESARRLGPGLLVETMNFDRPNRRSVPLGFGRVGCVEAGSGEATVLLHDFAEDSSLWPLSSLPAGRRYLAPDLPGHGASEKPRVEYAPELYLGALRELLDALEIAQADFVGHGLGAALALGLARREPGRVRSLAFLGPMTPAAFPGGRVTEVLFELSRRPRILLGLVRLLRGALARLELGPPGMPRGSVPSGVLACRERHYRDREFARVFVSTVVHWTRWVAFQPDVEELAQPLLLLWGERDLVYPPRQAPLLRILLPQSRLVLLPCGHWPHLELPDRVRAELEGFWEEVRLDSARRAGSGLRGPGSS